MLHVNFLFVLLRTEKSQPERRESFKAKIKGIKIGPLSIQERKTE